MSTTTAPFAAASASSLAEETAAILSFFLSFWWNKQTGRGKDGRNAVGKEYRVQGWKRNKQETVTFKKGDGLLVSCLGC